VIPVSHDPALSSSIPAALPAMRRLRLVRDDGKRKV
jgi:hypothetical protein